MLKHDISAFKMKIKRLKQNSKAFKVYSTYGHKNQWPERYRLIITKTAIRLPVHFNNLLSKIQTVTVTCQKKKKQF